MTLKTRRFRYVSFGLQITYTKCSGPDWAKFGWEMGCAMWGDLFSQKLMTRFWPDFSGAGNASKLLPLKNEKKSSCVGGEKIIYKNREVKMLPIFVLEYSL